MILGRLVHKTPLIKYIFWKSFIAIEHVAAKVEFLTIEIWSGKGGVVNKIPN